MTRLATLLFDPSREVLRHGDSFTGLPEKKVARLHLDLSYLSFLQVLIGFGLSDIDSLGGSSFLRRVGPPEDTVQGEVDRGTLERPIWEHWFKDKTPCVHF